MDVYSGSEGRKARTYYSIMCATMSSVMRRLVHGYFYTTGVPAMIGAMMIMEGIWNKTGVYNIEEFDPDPFMDPEQVGLPWQEDFHEAIR